MSIFAYGPRPGRTVTFSLTVDRPKSLPDGAGGTIDLPDTGVKGTTVRVTARVPSQEDRETISAHLADTTIQAISADRFRLNARGDSFQRYQREAILRLLVRLDDYVHEDDTLPEGDPERRFEPHTPEEVLLCVDGDVKNAIVEVLMSRIRLGEVLRGNSDGRSTSSTAAIPALDGTAANAASSTSAQVERVTAPPTSPTSTSRAQG